MWNSNSLFTLDRRKGKRRSKKEKFSGTFNTNAPRHLQFQVSNRINSSFKSKANDDGKNCLRLMMLWKAGYNIAAWVDNDYCWRWTETCVNWAAWQQGKNIELPQIVYFCVCLLRLPIFRGKTFCGFFLLSLQWKTIENFSSNIWKSWIEFCLLFITNSNRNCVNFIHMFYKRKFLWMSYILGKCWQRKRSTVLQINYRTVI